MSLRCLGQQGWKKEVEERLVLCSLQASSVHLTYLGVSQHPVEQFTQIIYTVPLIYSQRTGIRWFSTVKESRLERTLEIWSTCAVYLAQSPPCLDCPSYFLWGIVSLTCSFSLKQLGSALGKLVRLLRWNAGIHFLHLPLTFWCPFPIPHSSSHKYHLGTYWVISNPLPTCTHGDLPPMTVLSPWVQIVPLPFTSCVVILGSRSFIWKTLIEKYQTRESL